MGGHEGWAQPNGFFPNGLLPDEAPSVTRVLDMERWSRAEERTAELIACIQPNQPSEERRLAVANYVQRLMEKCFSCQVFTFGSVPLKTYLPDGDIDLTAFSKIQNLKDTWVTEVRDMLESEEKSDHAEFNVNEVHYIQAEVKIIKCLVENIVVDISFNQLGGLCTLCFLEEVDHLINKNHLFKRSIILIKAWCYYESRILGAHHGLISTYALETLVLYIFNVFNNSFAGPLEVLYRFLEFFSKFDWDNFCVSLWGPIPISSLPDMTAYPPRKDDGNLLLSKKFLNSCSTAYAVSLGGQENQEQPFISKYFNIIDPLRTNNNLGRSVSKGNFYRIRSAFSFGAQELAKLLDSPIENLKSEFNHFFSNTLGRHGKGHRPDTPCLKSPLTKSDGSDSHKDSANSKKAKENSTTYESEVDVTHASHVAPGISSQEGNHFLKRMFRSDNVHAVSRAQNQKTYSNLNSIVAPYRNHEILSRGSTEKKPSENGRSSRPDYSKDEVHTKYRFARTHSSPELTDTSSERQSQGREKRASETGKGQTASVRSDISMMRNLGAEVLENHTATNSSAIPLSSRQSSSHQSIGGVLGSNSPSNSYYGESGISAMREDHPFVSDLMQMNQEEQDLVNMMASARDYGFTAQVPVNLSSANSPLPMAHCMLSSPVYDHRNSSGMLPTNFSSFQPSWVSNMHYSQGLVSWPVSQYIPSLGLASNQEELTEPVEDKLLLRDLNLEDVDHDFWTEQGAGSVRSYDHDRGSFQAPHLENRQQFTSAASPEHSTRASSSDSSSVKDHGLMKEGIGLIRENYDVNSHYHRVRGTDAYSAAGSVSPPSLQVTSSKTKLSSESLDEVLSKTSKSTSIGQGRKTNPSIDPSVVYGHVKNRVKYEGELVDYVSSQANEGSQEWGPVSTVGTHVGDSEVSRTVAASHVPDPQPLGFELAAMSGSHPVLPVAPLPVGSDSRQRANSNQGVLPFAFYPTGPPVPFLTMVPVYNLPGETGSASNAPNHFKRNEKLNEFRKSQSDHSLVLNENHDQSEIFHMYNSVKSFASLESPEEHKSDILNSDFACHWQYLQYARFCQNGQQHGSWIYPPPNVVPPMYLQGHVPWDGHGRPPSGNMNVLTQLMGCSPLIPEPLQLNSHRPVGVYQHYTDKIPRYRGGTGTYLPNPKISLRDRQSTNTRNYRGNYNYERKDHHGDREGNWNSNSKPRYAGHGQGQGRNQVAKPSTRMGRSASSNNRSDKPWESFRHDTLPSHYSRSGSYSFPNSTNHISANMAYSMYPFPVVNPSEVSSSGSPLPSVIMLYPYDQSISYGSHAESIEFGSLGQLHCSGINEVSHLGEGSSRIINEQHDLQGHAAHSSPDQPSSPQFQRSTAQRRNMQAPSSFNTASGR